VSTTATTAIAIASTSFDYLEPEEISEAKKENPINDNTTKNRSRTDHPAKVNIVVKKPQVGKTTDECGLGSPTETPGCVIREPRTKGKRRYVWHRVKQVVRSMSL